VEQKKMQICCNAMYMIGVSLCRDTSKAEKGLTCMTT
jgi:hypothetical protein